MPHGMRFNLIILRKPVEVTSLDYEATLKKLEALRNVMDAYNAVKYASSETTDQLYDQLVQLYGEVADVIEKYEGKDHIEVPIGHDAKAVFPNYIEAGYLSGRTIHAHEGYTQLLKVIGKVKAEASRVEVAHSPVAAPELGRVLRRFRECCQYLKDVPKNERAVQDVVWIIIRAHFDRVDRETTLPQFGIKGYRPDFGIPELRTLVEVKFIGEKTEPPRIQDEILADVPAYLTSQSIYDSLVVFVYDAEHKLRDPAPFIRDLSSVTGITDIIVVPGIG